MCDEKLCDCVIKEPELLETNVKAEILQIVSTLCSFGNSST